MRRNRRFTSNDFCCWGMEVHNPDRNFLTTGHFLAYRQKPTCGTQGLGVGRGWRRCCVRNSWKENTRGWSASRSLAPPESGVTGEQIWFHVTEEAFNNELPRAGVKGRHWGAHAGGKGPTLGTLQRLTSWQRTKLGYMRGFRSKTLRMYIRTANSARILLLESWLVWSSELFSPY